VVTLVFPTRIDGHQAGDARDQSIRKGSASPSRSSVIGWPIQYRASPSAN
jgi:hypothetical protein